MKDLINLLNSAFSKIFHSHHEHFSIVHMQTISTVIILHMGVYIALRVARMPAQPAEVRPATIDGITVE